MSLSTGWRSPLFTSTWNVLKIEVVARLLQQKKPWLRCSPRWAVYVTKLHQCFTNHLKNENAGAKLSILSDAIVSNLFQIMEELTYNCLPNGQMTSLQSFSLTISRNGSQRWVRQAEDCETRPQLAHSARSVIWDYDYGLRTKSLKIFADVIIEK